MFLFIKPRAKVRLYSLFTFYPLLHSLIQSTYLCDFNHSDLHIFLVQHRYGWQSYHIESMDGTTQKMSVPFEQDGVKATLKLVYVKH